MHLKDHLWLFGFTAKVILPFPLISLCNKPDSVYKGMVYEYGTSEYEDFLSSVRDREDKNEVIRRPGSRAIIIVDIIQVMTVGIHYISPDILIWWAHQTCGWAVPNYDFKSYRTKLHDWAEGLESHDTSSPPPPQQQQGSKVENGDIAIHKDGMKSWWLTRNSKSLDGLPALHTAFEVEGSLASTRSYPGQQFPHLLLPKDSTSKKTSFMSNLEFCIGLGIGICLGITLSTLPVSHFPFRV